MTSYIVQRKCYNYLEKRFELLRLSVLEMNESLSKRQRYINIFVILKDSDTVEKIMQSLNNVLKSKNVKYSIEVRYSRVIPDFVYLKIVPKEFVNLYELKENVEESIRNLSEEIVWAKIEVVEVR